MGKSVQNLSIGKSPKNRRTFLWTEFSESEIFSIGKSISKWMMYLKQQLQDIKGKINVCRILFVSFIKINEFFFIFLYF